MDYFDLDFGEIPSIAPDLMFGDEPSPIKEPKILSQIDREAILQYVFDDHSYARPYPIIQSTSGTQASLTAPLTILKLHQNDIAAKKKNRRLIRKKIELSDDELDIETVDKPETPLVRYDIAKARHVMNEVETYLHSLWKDVEKDDEEKITRGSLSKEQARLFDTLLKVINNYQLAKLAYAMNPNEPVLRKIALEKATKRFRKTFGSCMWNAKLIVWLHGVMIDGLGSSLFLCYLEILQSLKRKVPAMFEKVLLHDKAASEKESTAGLPNLGARLRKSWEPSIGLQTKLNMDKFPTTPLLLIIQSGPSVPHQSTKRNRFWNNQLMNFGKAFPVNVPAYRTPEGYVVKYYLEHCISAVKASILEFRNKFPERPIVLMGWAVGALVACKVATIDKVDAVVCLGFPCNGMDGESNNDYLATFMKIDCPVLFFIGTHALSNSVEKAEELRKKIKAQTNLIVMESADELLRLTKAQKRKLGMTQNMIDKLIQDEIYLFLKNALFKPKPVCAPHVKSNQTPKKRKKKLGIADGVESKKKKKNIKQSPMLSIKTSDNSYLLQPLEASSLHNQCSVIAPSTPQGLLTTGSISTTIPVTQLQNETLISPTVKIVGQTVTSESKASKLTYKRTKEKTTKNNKKVAKTGHLSSQKFTANLGVQRSGNLSGQRISSTELPYPKANSQQLTLQRVPSGSFVLSGSSGPVRLQGGTNIVYLQQATSGSTQLIHTPLIANSSGTFTAVLSKPLSGNAASPSLSFSPLSGNQQDVKANSLSSPGSIFLNVPSNFNIADPAQSTNVESAIPISSTLPVPSICLNNGTSQPTIFPFVTSNTTINQSAVPTSTIMTQLSANDLRYLANLIAKHSCRSDSPLQVATSLTAALQKPISFDASTLNSPNPNTPTTFMSTKISIGALSAAGIKSPISASSISVNSEKKSPLLVGNQGTKKINYPPSLVQKVAANQKDLSTKSKAPLLKPPKIITNTIAVNRTSILSTSTSKGMTTKSPIYKNTQKVPVTLTIPISRLPSNLSNVSLSKSISVPGLSAYLAQQKFVLTSTKSISGMSNRTVVASPMIGKKEHSTSTSAAKSGVSVYPSWSKPSTNSNLSDCGHSETTARLTSKSPTITLHLPTQSLMKDQSTLQKAASDIKLVGILNQQTRKAIASPVNLSTLRSVSMPNSPVLSSTDDELSPITPRASTDFDKISADKITPRNVFVGPKSTLGGSKTGFNKFLLKNDVAEDNDVDFSVTPKTSPYALNKPVTLDPSKHIVDVAKLLHASQAANQSRGTVPHGHKVLTKPDTKIISRNLIELARLKMQDLGSKFSADSEITTTVSPSSSTDAKLKFEPLKVSTNRSKLTSVLSSMRETGKIIVDENGKMRATIVAKPTVVGSKAAALIAKTAFLTPSTISTVASMKTATVVSIRSSNCMSTVSRGSLTVSSFTNSKLLPSTGPTHTVPSAFLKAVHSSTAHKVSVALTANQTVPLTVKTNDFIRMSVQTKSFAKSPAIMKPMVRMEKSSPKESVMVQTSKETKFPKAITKEPTIVTKLLEDTEQKEPVPYVTRSGRILKARYAYNDDEKKVTLRKRRRTISSSKDDEPSAKHMNNANTPDTTQHSSVTLDNLLEAANLIRHENESKSSPTSICDTTSTAQVDSTANIAATAMLELLSSETKAIGGTNEQELKNAPNILETDILANNPDINSSTYESSMIENNRTTANSLNLPGEAHNLNLTVDHTKITVADLNDEHNVTTTIKDVPIAEVPKEPVGYKAELHLPCIADCEISINLNDYTNSSEALDIDSSTVDNVEKEDSAKLKVVGEEEI